MFMETPNEHSTTLPKGLAIKLKPKVSLHWVMVIFLAEVLVVQLHYEMVGQT